MTHPIERPSQQHWFLLFHTEWDDAPAPPGFGPSCFAIGEMREAANEGADDWRAFLDELRLGWHLDYHEWRFDDAGGAVMVGAVVLCVYHPTVADELETKFDFSRISDQSEAGIQDRIWSRIEIDARQIA